MNIISASQAVKEILNAVGPVNQASRSPFFFFLGAGISSPSVPLAGEIEEHCRKLAISRGVQDWAKDVSDLDSYSYWFQQAYQQPIQRQRYLRAMIEQRPISQANFRIAHLLLDRTITNLVFTSNFDDFLSRALTLFGKNHIVCDHPRTVERIDPEQEDIQIVHIHGTYWFYDCCNLKSEIFNRAQIESTSNATMANLLNNVLARRSPIIMGYSGWEDDVFMRALSRRLQSNLPYNVYWFAYSRSSIEKLPQWLKEHSQAVFIGPPESDDSERPATAKGKTQVVKKEEGDNDDIRDGRAIPTLPAREVLDLLIRDSGIKSPALTSDPLSFLANSLRESLAHEDESEDNDTYLIRSVIERIERADTTEKQMRETAEKDLDAVRDLLRRSQYKEAVGLVSKISYGAITYSQRRDLAISIFSRSPNSSNDETREPSLRLACDLLNSVPTKDRTIKDYAVLAAIYASRASLAGTMGQDEDAIKWATAAIGSLPDSVQIKHKDFIIASALNTRATSLLRRNQTSEALTDVERVLSLMGEPRTLRDALQLMQALNLQAILLNLDDRHEKALAAHSKLNLLAEKFEGEEVSRIHLNSIRNIARALLTHSQVKDAKLILDAALTKYGLSKDESIQTSLCDLINIYATWNTEKGHQEKALVFLEQIIQRASSWDSNELKNDLACAMLNKALRLRSLGKEPLEIEVYDSLFREFAHSTDWRLRRLAVMGQHFKAECLSSGKQFDTSIKSLDSIIAQFESDPHPHLRALVLRTLAIKAAVQLQKGQLPQAEKIMVDVANRISRSTKEVVAAMEGVQWVLLLSEFEELRNFFPALATITERLLVGGDLTPSDRLGLINTRMMVLIGSGRHEEAIKSIGDIRMSLKDVDIADLFNYAIAEWALYGRERPRDLFEYAIKTAGSYSDKRDRPNFNQCLAVALWNVGKETKAKAKMKDAIRLAKMEKRPIYSCWRFSSVSPGEFIKDCHRFESYWAGNSDGPPYLSQ